MSNRKSLKERLNNIKDKGPTKWLTRGLFNVTNPPVVVETYKDQGRDDSVSMGGSMPPDESNPTPPSRSRGNRFIKRLQGLQGRMQNDIDNQNFRVNNRRSNRIPKPYEKVLNRLEDPKLHPTIEDFHDQYERRQSPQFEQQWSDQTNFRNADDVISFLESSSGMGMTRGDDGLLRHRPRSPGEHMAAGRSPGEGASFQPFKGVTKREREIYQDPTKIAHVKGVAGGTDSRNPVTPQSLINFHKAAQKNGLPLAEVRKVIAQLHKSAIDPLYNIGAPSKSDAFNPPENWEATPQGKEGEWEGFTDYDLMQFAGDDDDQAMFKEGFGEPGVTRMESYVQRLINSGFRNEDTLTPIESFDGATEDHILGKESTPSGENPDTPLNRGIISSGVNLTKAGDHALGKDSFNHVINSMQDEDKDEKMIMTLLEMYPEEGMEEGDEPLDNKFIAHAAKRLLGEHFDPKRLNKVLFGGAKTGLTDSVEDIMGLEGGSMDDQLGLLNLKQLSRNMPSPGDPDHEKGGKYFPNTFNGASYAAGGPGRFKDNFAKIALLHMAKNPEIQEQLRAKEAELRAPRLGVRGQALADLSDDKVNTGMAKFKNELVKQLIEPLKGAASLYTVGGLGDGSHSELPKQFTSKGNELLDLLSENEEVSPHIEALRQGLLNDEESWTNDLTTKWGNRGVHKWDEHSSDPNEVRRIIKDFKGRVDFTKTLMRSAAAREKLQPFLKEAFFQGHNPNTDKFKDPIYESIF